MQALEIIADAKELILEEKEGGILYIRPKNPQPPTVESKKSDAPHAVTGFRDSSFMSLPSATAHLV
jgi:hypothetical protein